MCVKNLLAVSSWKKNLIDFGIVSTERLQTPRLRGELSDLWADPLGRAVLLTHRQQRLLVREHAGVLPALPGDDTRRRRRLVLDAGTNCIKIGLPGELIYSKRKGLRKSILLKIVSKNRFSREDLFLYNYLQYARPSDSGTYSCSPSLGDPVSVNVHVLRGERVVTGWHGKVWWLPEIFDLRLFIFDIYWKVSRI